MSFRPPSFSVVAAFEAAARHENFARAAAELNLTQSAISHAIRALEARLGEALFDRHGRRVTLTRRGGQLAKRIRASLELLENAFEDAGSDNPARRVIIGAPAEFAQRVLLPSLAAGDLLDSCDIRLGLPPAAIAKGSADVVIARGAGGWPQFACHMLGEDSLFPVAAPAIARLAGFPELDRLPMIENITYPWRYWLAQLRREEALPGLGLVVDDWGLALDAAKAGGGVCLTRASLARADLASGRLVRVGRAELPLDEGYHLLWDPDAGRRAPAQSVIEWLIRDLTAPRPVAAREDAELAGRPRIKLVEPR